MLEVIFAQIVQEKKSLAIPSTVIQNLLRERVQLAVLEYIYNQKIYKNLIFKGGSCLRICFGLPRLSEDLDFDQKIKGFSITDLEEVLEKEIKLKFFPKLETKKQGNKRLYLKFPILHKLGLASINESDKLFVKLEFDGEVLPFGKIELTPISQFGYNFIVRHYNLPTLMAGKISALQIDIKGRDFYDLYWFLQKGVTPNWKTLRKITGIKNEKELKAKLTDRIETVASPQKLRYDLQNFVEQSEFVADFAKNYKKIIKKYL